MEGWLIDVYRNDNKVIVWLKLTTGENKRLVFSFQSFLFIGLEALTDLNACRIPFKIVKKKNYFETKFVLAIKVPQLNQFEYHVRLLERVTRHQITLYNADIKPEQMFLYKHDLYPFQFVQTDGENIAPSKTQQVFHFNELKLEVIPNDMNEANNPIRKIVFDGTELKGPEEKILREFAALFNQCDPDVVIINKAYAVIPYLYLRLLKYGIVCNFHRWDAKPIQYKGGRSYWSYNQVRYQDFSIQLHGRLLVDTSTFVGSECDLNGIIELVGLSGTLFHPTVARSFGAVFQSALVRLMVREGMIIPYKEKPIEPPLSMFTMLKADRAGLTIDPQVGFHQNVAELDFVSMFPWLIYNHNISAECMLSEDGPFEYTPDLPIKSSLKNQGLIPRALKPFIDRRMYYKQHPSPENSQRARGLKWILVSCYGYLRYREFKLGIPTSHMAICAFARESLLKCMHLAEERGFNVVHGIIDSLYVSKPNMTMEDVEALSKEIEKLIHIPISCEGIFKWVVFLPSRIDPDRALPATYFGAFQNGEIKTRGIEVRQKGVPPIIKAVQEKALQLFKDCSTFEEIRKQIPVACSYGKYILEHLPSFKPSLFVSLLRVSKTEYKNNIPQKVILEKLLKRGIKIQPGQYIQFIYSQEGPVLVDEYKNNPDKIKYKSLLIRALAVVFQPFGFSKTEVEKYMSEESQFEFNFDAEVGDLEKFNFSLWHDKMDVLLQHEAEAIL